jgi:hypothetical protein
MGSSYFGNPNLVVSDADKCEKGGDVSLVPTFSPTFSPTFVPSRLVEEWRAPGANSISTAKEMQKAVKGVKDSKLCKMLGGKIRKGSCRVKKKKIKCPKIKHKVV